LGEILGGIGFDGKSIFAKWRIEPGNKRWFVENGDMQGRTWLSERSDAMEPATWNHPIDVHMKSSTLIGWPKLYIEVYSSDSFDLVDLGM
jgi:B9 domain-containing protein 2